MTDALPVVPCIAFVLLGGVMSIHETANPESEAAAAVGVADHK